MSNNKIVLFSIIIFAINLIALECVYRGLHTILKGTAAQRSPIRSDATFGWVHNTDVKKKILKNKCSEEVIRLPPSHRLINHLPKYNNDKTILIIGDSSTNALEVSTGSAYFAVAEECLKSDYSIYAAGIGGFGNLQEYMVLQAILPEVDPDIVVWQLCTNDISNNVYELDNASFLNNQRPRPYWDFETEAIVTRNPGFWLFDLSHGFRFVFSRSLVIDLKYNLGILAAINSLIELPPDQQKRFERQGFAVLDHVLGDVIGIVPAVKFYGFSSTAEFDEKFAEIFEKNGATYFRNFSQSIKKRGNTDCLPLDEHWNHKGHKGAGELLADLISAAESPTTR